YYKYDEVNKRYEKGEVILKDDTIDTEFVKKSLYNEKINTIAINAYLDKDYLITYDLTNNTSDKICISDYVDVYDYVEDRFSLAYENKIFWNNKDTVIFFEKKHNVIVTYNINSKEINCFKVSDYLDSSKTKGEHITSLDVNNGLLDVYIGGGGPEINNYRIDMDKKEIVSEKKFNTWYLWFEDDYIIYCDINDDKCFKVYRETLGDEEEIPCTEDFVYDNIRGFDITGDYLYMATFESIFKIDLKNKVRDKIADADKTKISGFSISLHMITENEGFMIGYKNIDEEDHETIFVWIN
nr:hypothetical protein [Lachnospiraceae bacterium]